MLLETKRLYIREFTPSDEQLVAPLVEGETGKKFIDHNLRRYEVYGFGRWAVCRKADGEMVGIGGITIQNIHGHMQPEVSCTIKESLRGNGYAQETALACLSYIFNTTPFNQVFCFTKNTFAQKIGMMLIDEYDDDAGDHILVYVMNRKYWHKTFGAHGYYEI